MDEIILKVENITPIFIAGADQKYIDNEGLRAPTLKGLLRWWFRALMGGMVPTDTLRSFEEKIFGSTDKKSPVRVLSFCDSQPSKINIPSNLQYLWFSIKLQKKRRERLYCYPPGTEFEVILRSENNFLDLVAGCLWLLIYLGGVGSRSRRGAGSLKVKRVKSSSYNFVYDFVFRGNNVSDAKNFMEENLKRIFNNFKEYVNEKYDPPQNPQYFPILSKSSAKITLLDHYNDNWEDALTKIGKDYRDFRRKLKGKKWKYRCLFGLPIMRGPSQFKKERQASPLHIGIIDLNKGYTTRVVKFYTSINPTINKKVFKNKGIFKLKEVLDDLNNSLKDEIKVEIPR
ncbi:MAG: type III-B CRISPR module RAMP protein Cmr1 [Methanothermobacter tenebrarum]